MRTYGKLVTAGFRRHSRYRQAAIASALTNTIFGLIRASLLLTALHAVGGPIGGYDAMAAVTYAWLSQAMIGPVDVWGSNVSVGESIKSGEITAEFLRPVSIVGAALSENFGRAAFEFLPRSVPILSIGALLTGLRLPTSPLTYLAGFASLLMAIVLCYTYFYAIQLVTLWTHEYRGYTMLGVSIQQILCGFVVPVTWFPPWLYAIDAWLPFPSMFQTTVDVFTGMATGQRLLQSLLVQAFWTLALLGLCQTLLMRGRRRVVIQGG